MASGEWGTEWTGVTVQLTPVPSGRPAHVCLVSVSAWGLLCSPLETRKLGPRDVQSFAAAEWEVIAHVCWFNLFFNHYLKVLCGLSAIHIVSAGTPRGAGASCQVTEGHIPGGHCLRWGQSERMEACPHLQGSINSPGKSAPRHRMNVCWDLALLQEARRGSG